MATDWTATVREQADIADRTVADVMAALRNQTLTLGQATRLYRAVQEGAQALDQIVHRMKAEELEEPIHEAAGVLQDIWTNLYVATANRVRMMQGLEPIELPRDFDVD